MKWRGLKIDANIILLQSLIRIVFNMKKKIIMFQKAAKLFHLLNRLCNKLCNYEKFQQNIVVFLDGVVKIQADSDYERLPMLIQCQIVELIGKIEIVDPDNKWSVWKASAHNKSSCCKPFMGIFNTLIHTHISLLQLPDSVCLTCKKQGYLCLRVSFVSYCTILTN